MHLFRCIALSIITGLIVSRVIIYSSYHCSWISKDASIMAIANLYSLLIHGHSQPIFVTGLIVSRVIIYSSYHCSWISKDAWFTIQLCNYSWNIVASIMAIANLYSLLNYWYSMLHLYWIMYTYTWFMNNCNHQ